MEAKEKQEISFTAVLDFWCKKEKKINPHLLFFYSKNITAAVIYFCIVKATILISVTHDMLYRNNVLG